MLTVDLSRGYRTISGSTTASFLQPFDEWVDCGEAANESIVVRLDVANISQIRVYVDANFVAMTSQSGRTSSANAVTLYSDSVPLIRYVRFLVKSVSSGAWSAKFQIQVLLKNL